MIPELRTGRHDDRLESNAVPGVGNPRTIRVLMYHRVVASKAMARLHWSFIHVDAFRSHLEYLDRWGYTPITFDDFRLFQEGQLDLPKKPVILTFDDGYAETYTLAFPVLQEFAAKAVIFVLGERKVRTNYWDQGAGFNDARLLEGQEMLEMHAWGMEIGSHSLTHPRLPLLREQHVWEEISRSRILLEILINAPVRSFAYPYGLVSSTAKRLVQSAGYSQACSVGSGPAFFGSDMYEIRRIAIPGDLGPAGLGMRLLATYQMYSWSRWQARRLAGRENGYHDGTGDHVPTTLDTPANVNEPRDRKIGIR